MTDTGARRLDRFFILSLSFFSSFSPVLACSSKASWAHRTGENEKKKDNDKIKKSVQTSSACGDRWLMINVVSLPVVKLKMSRVVRKPAFCICENKDADQLRGNREADQRLCFRYTDSTIPLLPKSEISSL